MSKHTQRQAHAAPGKWRWWVVTAWVAVAHALVIAWAGSGQSVQVHKSEQETNMRVTWVLPPLPQAQETLVDKSLERPRRQSEQALQTPLKTTPAPMPAPASAPESPVATPVTDTHPQALAPAVAANHNASSTSSTSNNGSEAAPYQSTPSKIPSPVVLPSSYANYLNNPAPAYPGLSRRMGEQGTVVLRVLINPEGRAEKVEVLTSSGYSRLDEAALEAVLRWRFVPGKRDGVPEPMWFNLPVRFVLD